MSKEQKSQLVHHRDMMRFVVSERSALRLVLLLIVLGLGWIAYRSLLFPPSFNPVDIGAGRVPLGTAIVGIVCSVVLFILAGASQKQIEIRHPLKVFFGAVLVLLYAYVMPYVGFYIASVVAVPLLLFNGGERRWLWLLLYTLESPRVLRRLHFLREWSHEQEQQVFP